jgi:hypothetical protein
MHGFLEAFFGSQLDESYNTSQTGRSTMNASLFRYGCRLQTIEQLVGPGRTVRPPVIAPCWSNRYLASPWQDRDESGQKLQRLNKLSNIRAYQWEGNDMMRIRRRHCLVGHCPLCYPLSSSMKNSDTSSRHFRRLGIKFILFIELVAQLRPLIEPKNWS